MGINIVVAQDRESADLEQAFLVIDVEARDYLLNAARLLGVSGMHPLARLDPWEDEEFGEDEVPGLASAVAALRAKLGATFAEGALPQPELEPPARVGFLDDGNGLPFGREGTMRLLIELENLLNRAVDTGQRLIAIGD